MTLSRSVDGGSEREHILTTLGSRFRMSERLHLGGLLQFDRSEMKTGGDVASGEVGGRGWMSGPYFAARDASHPLFLEGRQLYGRVSNDVGDLVLVLVLNDRTRDPRSASFDSEQWLVQARMEGTCRLENGATLIPLADLGHAREEMEPFLACDNSDKLIDGQTITVTMLQIGAELEIPVETAWGDLLFRPGLRFVASDSSGGALAGAEGEEAGPRSRGRIDFGIDYSWRTASYSDSTASTLDWAEGNWRAMVLGWICVWISSEPLILHRPVSKDGNDCSRQSPGSTPFFGTLLLPTLTRAGLSHLHFESIHPFEDGNGRLGRTLAEKSLAQHIGQSSLISLAFAIDRERKAYYDQLELHQKTLDVAP